MAEEKIRVAINGFGRIGRQTFKCLLEIPSIEVIAINDLTNPKTLAHLLKYDSNYGIYPKTVDYDENSIIVDGKSYQIISEPDPSKLPWKDLKIDIALESTGRFTKKEDAEKHLQAGAKLVIISAPSKSPDVPTFVLGVNEDKFDPKKDKIVSNASCTTNALAPLIKVLNDHFGIEKGLMSTVHSYTNDQRILDLPHKDLRRARAAALNIIPTTTGAAIAATKAVPELEGKIDGLALRVPTPTVSIVDLVCLVKKSTNVEEINQVFKKEAEERLKGILGVSDLPLVSNDFKGTNYSAVVDLTLTMVKDNLVKVFAWYDNEMGYSRRYAEITELFGKKIKQI